MDPRQRLKAWLMALALALPGLWHAVVAPLPGLVSLELGWDDLRQQALLPAVPTPEADHLVIIDIDDASLAAIGRWPWSRDHIARLVTELTQRQQVAALGMDLVFAEPDHGGWPAVEQALGDLPEWAEWAARRPQLRQRLDHDRQLALALQGQPVVLGYYLTADRPPRAQGPQPHPALPGGTPPPPHSRWTGHVANVPALAQAAPRAGFINVLPDADGTVRSLPAVAWAGGQWHESLGLAVFRQVSGLSWQAPERQTPSGPDQPAPLTALRLSEGPGGAASFRLPLGPEATLRVPLQGPAGPNRGSFTYLSAATLLAGALPAGHLAGKIALLGSSAPGLADLRPTAIHPTLPGVEVHAHFIAGLLSGKLAVRPDWSAGFEALLLTLSLLATVHLSSLRSARAALAGVTGLLLLLLATNMAAAQAGWLLPVASVMALTLLLSLLLLGRNYLAEWRGRQALAQVFGQYLPPHRAREVVQQPQARRPLEAHNRTLSILFCDLRGFSTLGETLPPQALRVLLNTYFAHVTRIVHQHEGTLDKFIGDAVMAFWGAPQDQPDHAGRAVMAAQELARSVATLNAQLAALGLPAVDYGIGLASGEVCVGDLGSPQRRSYTAVGDAVNLAARIETLTRHAGVRLLVSDSTHEACTHRVTWVEVDRATVRGRRQTVTVFTPLTEADLRAPRWPEQVRAWQLALRCLHRHHHPPSPRRARAVLAPWLSMPESRAKTCAPTLLALAAALHERLAAPEMARAAPGARRHRRMSPMR